MKKIVYVLIVVLMILSAMLVFTGFNNKENNLDKETSGLNSNGNIIINEIQNLAAAKIMCESKIIAKEELPEELSKYANVACNEASMISILYTKSDLSNDEFDFLHDYVFYFFNEEENRNYKISVTKEENNLRDYFFQATNDQSSIDGHDVIISKYDDRYIINFKKGDYHFDVETNGYTEAEMLNIVKDIIKQ